MHEEKSGLRAEWQWLGNPVAGFGVAELACFDNRGHPPLTPLVFADLEGLPGVGQPAHGQHGMDVTQVVDVAGGGIKGVANVETTAGVTGKHGPLRPTGLLMGQLYPLEFKPDGTAMQVKLGEEIGIADVSGHAIALFRTCGRGR